jgi:hypothetical protein
MTLWTYRLRARVTGFALAIVAPLAMASAAMAQSSNTENTTRPMLSAVPSFASEANGKPSVVTSYSDDVLTDGSMIPRCADGDRAPAKASCAHLSAPDYDMLRIIIYQSALSSDLIAAKQAKAPANSAMAKPPQDEVSKASGAPKFPVATQLYRESTGQVPGSTGDWRNNVQVTRPIILGRTLPFIYGRTVPYSQSIPQIFVPQLMKPLVPGESLQTRKEQLSGAFSVIGARALASPISQGIMTLSCKGETPHLVVVDVARQEDVTSVSYRCTK